MTTKTHLSIEEAAKLLHKNNRVFCAIFGDESHSNWGNLAQHMRDSIISGVKKFLENPEITPEQSHQAWVEWKQANGWVFGKQKDIEKKVHPNLVPFDKLPEMEQAKDRLFIGILKAIKPLIVVPAAEPKKEESPAAEAAPDKA